jgi:formate dehydrogenase assembly factor FdhD
VNRPILTVPVQKVEGNSPAPFRDLLAVEEPLNPRQVGNSVTVDLNPGIESRVIHCLPDDPRRAQPVFERTGGLHAAALFSPEALIAGIPILAAVGAHSNLAVETAPRFNLTLLGFVRDSRFNIYSGASRIQ